MKKAIISLAVAAVSAVSVTAFAACDNSDKIYVDTNAFFAPFEYYDGDRIVGVDVDIMNLVGEKLGKKVVFENTEFGPIIDNVSSGKKYDCGAAGITITEERQSKVDFSIPYYTSVQYVIYKGDTLSVDGTAADGTEYVLWSSLAGKKIGVQTETTGDIYVNGEITGDGFDGVLKDSGAKCVQYDNAQIAVDAIGSGQIDTVVVDMLTAQYMVGKNDSLHCYALYYSAEKATEEQYAICVTKGNTELLNAINGVLEELGNDGIDKLVAKHLGLN